MRFLSSVFSAAVLVLPLAALAQPALQRADLIITHAHVVTMNARREIIEDGAVIIRGSRIIAVGPAALAAQFDESGALGDRMHRDGLHGGAGRTGIPGENRGSACEKGENGEADHGEIFKRENWRFQRIFS